MRSHLVAAALCLGVGACGSGDDAPATNHTVTIQNGGTNTVECVARQFTRLTLTPTGGGATADHEFVSSPGTTIDVPVALPATGTFALRIYTPAGHSIWWDGLGMAVGGTTPVSLQTINTGFYPNSYAAGLRSTGNDIPCQ